MSTRWRNELTNPLRYRRQIQRLYARFDQRHRLDRLQHDGVSFATVMQNDRHVAQLLAQAVADGTYELGPAKLVRVFVKDRYRELFHFPAFDFVLHGVIGEIVSEAIEPRLSSSLYSYRRFYSSWTAVRRFAAYVRAHRADRPDPRTRGLYVFRADIRKYADSIPVGDRSLLWAELQTALELTSDDPRWRLVRRAVQPEMVDAETGAAFMRWRGLALGSPIGTAIMNFYLCGLDHELDRLGGYYVRFGDDLLIAHADADVVRRAVEIVEAYLAERGLVLNEKKRQLLFLNGAGRASATWPEARGAQRVVFLGCEAAFDGTVTLPTKKIADVMTELDERIRRVVAVLRGSSLPERARAACAISNETLDPLSPFCHRHAGLFRRFATDRSQLAAFDYRMALRIAEALTGVRGVRAFRTISWRRMRQEFGLRSLVALRNAEGA